LAYEVAIQLQRRGYSVKGLVLIDSPVPVDHQALPRAIVQHVLNSKLQRGENTTFSTSTQQALAGLSTQFERHAGMLQAYSSRPSRVVDRLPCVAISCCGKMDTQKLCGVTYPWLEDKQFRANCLKQWEQLVRGPIPVLELQCNHFEVFDADHVSTLSIPLFSLPNLFRPIQVSSFLSP
jgi:thioesterase domain-containing protein